MFLNFVANTIFARLHTSDQTEKVKINFLKPTNFKLHKVQIHVPMYTFTMAFS